MTRPLRRIASLAVLPVAVMLMAAGSPRVVSAAPPAQPPVITRVSPQVLVENGQPLRITLTGSGLSAVATVFLSPVVADRSFIAFNDTTLLVTLPANLAAGEYSITVSSPAGSTDAGAAVFTVQPSAPAVVGGGSGPVTIPRYTFDPYPAVVGKGDAAVPAPAAVTPRPVRVGTVTSSNQVSDPVIIAAVGVVAGTLLYLLWGRPGRLAVARRKGFFAQVVVRPVQRLHLGRICLQCGRLHWLMRTRRDLWRAGAYCSATCFVAAQDEDLSSRRSDTHAIGRLRELGIYVEMEHKLALIFAAEAAAVGLASNLFAAEGGMPPLDSTMASWTVVAVPAPVGGAVPVQDAVAEEAPVEAADVPEAVDPDVEGSGTATPVEVPAPAVGPDASSQERRRRRWWPWSSRSTELDAEPAVDVEDGGPTPLPFQPDDLDTYDAARVSAAERAAELIDFDIVAPPSGGDADDDHDPMQSVLAASTLAEAAHVIERVTSRRRRAAEATTELMEPVKS